MKYINVVGGPGSGKSHFSKQISAKLNLEYIELDALNWQENWKAISREEFIPLVKRKLNEHQDGWVVDGSYHQRLGDVVRDKADAIIFLKIPLYISLPRVIFRSGQRIITGELLWGKNKESLKGAATLAYWTVKYHRRRIKKMRELEQEIQGSEIIYKIFTRNKQARKWLSDVT